jgi:uncharacterized protein (DUF1684 family)
MKKLNVSIIVIIVAATFACTPTTPVIDENQWSEDLEAWRAKRMDGLLGDRGWASISGLDWLNDGANTLGSLRGSTVQFDSSSAVERVGIIWLSDGQIQFESDANAEVFLDSVRITAIEMLPDDTGSQTILTTGTVQFAVVRRGTQLGVRTWDSQAESLVNFNGIPIYTPDPNWVIPATFHRYEPIRFMDLATVIDIPEKNPIDGYLEFNYAGETYNLDVIAEPADTSMFVIFADETNRTETYGAGRYIYVDRKDTAASISSVIIDFNRSYNPPCAFTAYSTCALPPAQNILPFPIPSGEKRYH